MKRYLTIIALLVFATSLTVAQQDTKPVTDKSKTEQAEEQKPVEGPQMTLESMVVEYGEIENGSDPLRSVAFTNTGTEPLVISNAKGSCGCTVPKWPREPIAPGETSKIEIRYDTKRPGPINKTVRLTTNDAAGQHVIRLSGRVKAKAKEDGLPQKEGIFNKQNGKNN